MQSRHIVVQSIAAVVRLQDLGLQLGTHLGNRHSGRLRQCCVRNSSQMEERIEDSNITAAKSEDGLIRAAAKHLHKGRAVRHVWFEAERRLW